MQPDYQECRQALVEAGVELAPAEAHGILCGLLCARGDPGVARWLEELALDPRRTGGQEGLAALLRHAVAGMRSEQLEFTPLLPGDERELGERVVALAEWSRGYLYGLGIGGVGELSALPAECRELIDDLARFARLDSSEVGGEDDEWSFAELVEYLRVGVELVRTVLEQRRAGAARQLRSGGER